LKSEVYYSRNILIVEKTHDKKKKEGETKTVWQSFTFEQHTRTDKSILLYKSEYLTTTKKNKNDDDDFFRRASSFCSFERHQREPALRVYDEPASLLNPPRDRNEEAMQMMIFPRR